MMKKVGLALSGGGTFGFAHIGVLQVLVENNIPVDVITGTSMGALVGGAFASGKTIEEIMQIVKKFRRSNILDLNPFVLTSSGLLFGKKVTRLIERIVGKINIEDIKIKYAAIACDLKNAGKIVMDKGSMVDAIRASISIPGIFAPLIKDDMCLVDGGCVDNLPVEDARKMGAEVVISSDVCSFYIPHDDLKNIVDIVISSFDCSISTAVRKQSDKGDIHIKIDQPDVSFDKFSQKEIISSIEHGRVEALKMLPKIKELLGME